MGCRELPDTSPIRQLSVPFLVVFAAGAPRREVANPPLMGRIDMLCHANDTPLTWDLSSLTVPANRFDDERPAPLPRLPPAETAADGGAGDVAPAEVME